MIKKFFQAIFFPKRSQMIRKERTKIYVKVTPERSEIICSGITFAEFIKHLPTPIENLLLIKCDYWGNQQKHGFEVLEGQENVEKLIVEDISHGDFCFVDYTSPQAVNELHKKQIAELLYLGHVFEPLDTPFFEALHNNFIYLSHDDGWYCKLYCKNISDFATVLCNKIAAIIPTETGGLVSDSVKEKILQLATNGILIDLDEILQDGMITLYSIGEHSDIDGMLNNWQQMKSSASKVSQLDFYKSILLESQPNPKLSSQMRQLV